MRLLIRRIRSTDRLDRFDCGDEDLNTYAYSYATRFCGDGYPSTIVAVDEEIDQPVGLLFLNSHRGRDSSGQPLPPELGSVLVLDSIMVTSDYHFRGVATQLFREVFRQFVLIGPGLGLQAMAVAAQDDWLRIRLTREGLRQSGIVVDGYAISWRDASERYEVLLSQAEDLGTT